MIRIIGEKASGKTTMLIEKARINPNNYCIVAPTKERADYIRKMAKGMDCDVDVISAFIFFFYRQGRRDKKYLVDELDTCLAQFGIVGYTNEP